MSPQKHPITVAVQQRVVNAVESLLVFSVLYILPFAHPSPRIIHVNPNVPFLLPALIPPLPHTLPIPFPFGNCYWTLGFCGSAAVYFLLFFFVVILHTWVKSFATCLSPPGIYHWACYRLATSTSLQMVGFVFFLWLLTALFKLDFILPFCLLFPYVISPLICWLWAIALC